MLSVVTGWLGGRFALQRGTHWLVRDSHTKIRWPFNAIATWRIFKSQYNDDRRKEGGSGKEDSEKDLPRTIQSVAVETNPFGSLEFT